MRTAIRLAIGAVIGAVLAMLITVSTASATPPPDDNTFGVAGYTCSPRTGECVWNPDPAGDPVAIEPDNDPVPVAYVDHDGPFEDSPGFDCRTNGNGVCGPLNDSGHTPGCYNRNTGALVLPWREEWRTDRHYRPPACGRPTARDRAMTDRLNGGVGQLCAANTTGGRTCWYVDSPRPRSAVGPARFVGGVS